MIYCGECECSDMLKIVLWVSLLSVLLVVGCKKDNVGSGDVESPRGELPHGWHAAALSPMRKASFMVKGSRGTVADISLVVQSGRAGGLLNHINGWRTQFGLAALDRLQFEQAAEWITIPAGEAVLVDIREEVSNKKNQSYDGRLVALIVEKPQETWFFKMRGNSELVEAHKKPFFNWVGTVKPTQSEEDISLFGSGASASVSSPATELISQLARENPPQWRLPESWVQISARPEHYATFSLPSPDEQSDGKSGSVSVVLLDGDGGGAPAIVNRQRSQLRLPSINKQHSAAMVESLWSANSSMSMVSLASPRGSMVAAWLTPRKEGTWLFLLRGPAVVVKKQKPNFAQFLQSIRFSDE